MCILNWINENSGFVMVILTFAYVVATAFIFRANNKSATAALKQVEESKRQLEESRRQYEDSKRLGVMPVLTIESENGIVNRSMPYKINSDIKSILSNIQVKNIGLGTAHSIKFFIDFNQGNEKWEELIRYLQVGETAPIGIQTYYSEKNKDEEKIFTIDFSFYDLLNNEYCQRIDLYCTSDHGSFSITDCKVHDVTLKKGELSDAR